MNLGFGAGPLGAASKDGVSGTVESPAWPWNSRSEVSSVVTSRSWPVSLLPNRKRTIKARHGRFHPLGSIFPHTQAMLFYEIILQFTKGIWSSACCDGFGSDGSTTFCVVI